MGHRRFKYTKKDLPEILPIFPLFGALLLPGGDLPLNVFEDRYLAMIHDALATNRMIGIIQPKCKRPQSDEPREIYDVGCAGQISSFTENADGRMLITLTGICRFKVEAELPIEAHYRRIKANWDDFFLTDLHPSNCCLSQVRPKLMSLLEPYLNKHDMFLDFEKVEDIPDDRLMTCLSMICPFDKAEQQALLEARNHQDRCTILMTMLDFALANLENEKQQ